MGADEHKLIKTILIVEDDEAIRELLTLSISQETPYHPIGVPDGLQALEVVKDLKPNLLLVDYRLPSMSGIELYDRIHALEDFGSVPIILTSASNLEQELEGRNITLLLKPFELDQLLTMIKEHLD